jgi:hypothetical protein
LIQKLINDLLWITNKFQITVQFEWVPGHLEIRDNEIVDQLAKETVINEDDRLSDSGYISLIYVKVSVRRSCLRDWTKYIMEMHRKKRMGRFYMQHFGIRSIYWKACKTITAKRTYAALNQLKLGYRYFRSYLIRTSNCESNKCFNSCRAKQTPEHLLISCRTYRLERQLMIRIAK